MTSRPRNVAGKLTFYLAVFGLVACGRASSPTPSTPGGEQRPDSLQEVAPADAEQAPAPEAPPPTPAPAAAPASEANEPAEARDRVESSATAVSARPHDDLQTAQAELERARVELNQALAAPNAHAAKSPSGAAASRGAADEAPAKAEKKSEGSSCSTACRAFSSLERAATAVCRITGEKDGRCSHAHALVVDAKKRVAVCPCTSE
jgi:hypothetical protein